MANRTLVYPIQVKANRVFSPLRQKWLQLTPEERVRQEYLLTLINEYGYSLDQIAEEQSVVGRGSGDARADFLIWRTAEAKRNNEHAFIVVECKADNVSISLDDYKQGANYAQYEHAPIFVTHNNKETKYWRVDATRRMPNYIEVDNIPPAGATDAEIRELLARQKTLTEDEFASLLGNCHNVIRNREKKDPAAAFDEIAKILFIKVAVERRMRAGRERQNRFTAEFLDQQGQLYDNPIEVLFEQTKKEYRADHIFETDEAINLKPATVREIVRLLERYNLSDTSEDIKGIAFERFLGRTFRGEIGQFFTPRPIVEFMVRMVRPGETHAICDPACCSGGFLIRFFEILRQQILADIDRQYHEYKAQLDVQPIGEEQRARLLTAKYAELQESVDQGRKGSRLWHLANSCIYGCDANDRMARTAKMNMIMHGDGHGGVHHHDGFINVNGIFENRFDIVLTNPPFGANVEKSDVIVASDVTASEEEAEEYRRRYGTLYEEAIARVRAAVGQPLASLFQLPRSGRIRTELLFIERCLDLLKPGGRLGIVLPEGVFNNPSLAHVREFVEDRAYIRAVVSLPPETFYSAGASVKASLLFAEKFTEDEAVRYERTRARCRHEAAQKYLAEHAEELGALREEEARGTPRGRGNDVRRRIREHERAMESSIAAEVRACLRSQFDYKIFMYDAEYVGITATGERGLNELYPSADFPKGWTDSALELYERFRANPDHFAAIRGTV